MRLTPIGLIVIATVFHNQGAYLTSTLLFAFVDTIIPSTVAADVGHVIRRPVSPTPRVDGANTDLGARATT